MKNSAIKVHVIGGLMCLLIAGSSVYFATSAVNKRRGVFLNSRHELANVKSMLMESTSQRVRLTSRVQVLKESTSRQVALVPVSKLNSRTAKIVGLAESVGVDIDSLQPEARITDKRVPVQPMMLIGNADADDLFSLLNILGDQMPDIHIQLIEIESISPESSLVHIQMRMYWFIDPAS